MTEQFDLQTREEFPKAFNVLGGGNFSGRSAYLRRVCGIQPFDEPVSSTSVYLSPEPEAGLTGFSLTVEQELAIHDRSRQAEFREQIVALTGLELLLRRQPVTLSGGETAKLVLGCAMLLRPHRFAIDCTLEQLDFRTKRHFLLHFSTAHLSDTRLCICDNRIAEQGYAANIFPPMPRSAQISRFEFDTSRYPPIDVSPASIELESIAFRYGTSFPQVLHDIDVLLKPAEIYFLEGENGSGKSTLAKVLCGVARPQRGTMRVDGMTHRPWAIGNHLVSYHFQNPDRGRLRPTLRQELTASIKYIRGTVSSDDLNRCHAIAATFGMASLLDTPIDILPYALRKRMALAIAFTPVVPWLFLDEPTLAQDDESVAAMADLLSMERSRGRGIIVVSHSQALRSRLQGVRLVLSNGRLSPG